MPRRPKPFLKKPVPVFSRPAKPKKPIDWLALEQKGTATILSGRAPKIPIETDSFGRPIDVNQPGWCSGYATRAAKTVFGLDYAKSDAWLLADNNSVVQTILRKNPTGKFEIPFDRIPVERAKRIPFTIAQFERVFRPGRIICVYYSWSPHNKEAKEKGRPYTHAMLYLGKDKRNRHTVLHNVDRPTIETIENALMARQGNGLITEVIQPKIKKN